MEVSKTEFAALAKVSQGRVSQWISEGKIGPEEMLGGGRNARIKVEPAFEKLKLRLDPGQRNGNGIETNLNLQKTAAPTSESDHLDGRIKRAKAETAEALNRKAAEEENARKGIYVRAEEASAEAGKLASTILQMFEGGLADAAAEIAATYKLPQRDLVHLMHKRFRDVRVKVSAKLANDAAALPATVEEKTG